MLPNTFSPIKNKLARLFILTLSLASHILWGQENKLSGHPTDNTNLLALATSNSTTGNPPVDQHVYDERIQRRTLDLNGYFYGEYRERVNKWDELFIHNRQSQLTAAAQEIVLASYRIKDTQGLDASQLKSDRDFQELLKNKIAEVLKPDKLKADLVTWAKDVEWVTRTRVIEYFQEIVAEDLGKKFDQNLSNQVVNAVLAIPVEEIVAQAGSSAKIEQAILSSLPESAISAASRKDISIAASFLVKNAISSPSLLKNITSSLSDSETGIIPTSSLPDAETEILIAPLIADVAGKITQAGTQAALFKINEIITEKPNPYLVSKNFEVALQDWNSQNLDPRLEKILADFRDHVIEQFRLKAHEESMLILP